MRLRISDFKQHSVKYSLLLIFGLIVGFFQYAVSAEQNTSVKTSKLGPQLIENTEYNPVFGQNLFEGGGFNGAEFKGFNPNYRVAIGDKIILQMWGAYEVNTELTVDGRGNIFIPQVGPVKVQGVANQELNQVIEKSLRSVYQNSVYLYASLNATEPVKLFVTGFVKKPGLYGGFASDSILAFLAKAGGIRSESGSYLNVILKRGGEIRASFNLYDFLLKGSISQVQLHDGDTLLVNARQSVAMLDGLVENPVQIEFVGEKISLSQALALVGLLPEATHVRIARNRMKTRNVEYLSLAETENVILNDGDTVTVVADKMPGTISVSVEGEHDGQAIYILPYGSTLKDLLEKLPLNQRSNLSALQLFREDIALRQKEMLEVSLQQLETTTLSARSKSDGEAKLRSADAQSILQFIERAKVIKPRGQVLLGKSAERLDVMLKNQDRVVIPSKTVLVQVHGEVMFPNASVFNQEKTLQDYIASAGGYSQKADQSRVLVLHSDGTMTRVEYKKGFFRGGKLEEFDIQPGDEILVMPQVDVKSMQYTKDIMQVIYQIAASAAVVLSF